MKNENSQEIALNEQTTMPGLTKAMLSPNSAKITPPIDIYIFKFNYYFPVCFFDLDGLFLQQL